MKYRGFIPAEGLTIEGDVIDGKIVGQWQQDIKDGAALRRLRDALPEDSVIRMEGPWGPDGGPMAWSVGVVLLPLDPAGDALRPYANGATIAEAADKCREALK